MVKACQSHKVLRMAARPPLFARKNPAGQPMWHSIWWATFYPWGFLSSPDTWRTGSAKQQSFKADERPILLRKYEKNHLQMLNFPLPGCIANGQINIAKITIFGWVRPPFRISCPVILEEFPGSQSSLTKWRSFNRWPGFKPGKWLSYGFNQQSWGNNQQSWEIWRDVMRYISNIQQQSDIQIYLGFYEIEASPELHLHGLENDD